MLTQYFTETAVDKVRGGRIGYRAWTRLVQKASKLKILEPLQKEYATRWGLGSWGSWNAALKRARRPKLQPVPKGKWYTQAFPQDGYRYAGLLDRDLTAYGWIEHMKKDVGATKQFQLRVPADLHWWLKQYAAKNRMTMTDVMVRYLQSLRAREEGRMRVEEL